MPTRRTSSTGIKSVSSRPARGSSTRPASSSTAGVKEKENTVLGYGINALKALYPSIEYTRRTNPILNVNYRSNDTVKEEVYSIQDFHKDASESLEELSEKFTNNSSLNVLFSGFKADFNIGFSNSKNSTKENVYLKAYGVKFTYRELMNKFDYKNNLDSQFANDLNSSMSPKTLFDIYGTHLIVGALYGGRADICNTTEKSSDETAEELKAKLEIGYKDIASVSNNTEWTKTMKSVMSRTDFHASSIGGDGDLNNTSMDNFSNDFQRWLKSITKANSEFCSIYDRDSLVPVWDLAASSRRSNELKNYYESELSKLNNTIASNDSYITELIVGTGSSYGDACAAITAISDEYHILDLDMNYSCHSGYYIYIGYKLGSKANAIKDIQGLYCTKVSETEHDTLNSKNGATYTRVTGSYYGDLNRGVKGTWIYLYTSKNANKKPVRRINAALAENVKATDNLGTTVTWFDTANQASMNRGSKSGKKTFVYMKR